MVCTTERPRILVIDDEIGTRESLRFLLKRTYEVTCVGGVDEGLQAVQREAPDLVFLDIRMPGKSGIQGLRELRARDTVTSVVMLTGFGALETVQESLRLGANDYVNKPFDTGELLRLAERMTALSQVERRRAQMLQELRDMNSHLVEDLAAKERLVALGQTSTEVAHDLRNPLMVTMGYISLLDAQLEKLRHAMGADYREAAEYLDVVEKNLQRCLDLIRMWQETDGGQASRHQPVALAALMEDLRVSVAPLAMAAHVGLELQASEAAAVVRGSRAQLIRAVHNLVANAIDAVVPGSGQIRVRAMVGESEVGIEVSDNGCGMPPEVQARMFEPYFTTKPKGKGTGLGLAIARRIAEEHGGGISVESAPEQGTSITVRLPRLADADGTDGRSEASSGN